MNPPRWAKPGPATGCGPFKYTDPNCYYTSGALHTTELVDLKPATRYVYRVVGDTRQWSFSTPPAPGAAHASFGVVGDLGQTQNSSKTVENMLSALNEGQIGQVLFPGDLSYADGDGVLQGAELLKLVDWVWDSFHPGGVALAPVQRQGLAKALLAKRICSHL